MRDAKTQRKSTASGRLGKSGKARGEREWMNSGAWMLPSGQRLAEFALQAGFLAPLMLGADGVAGLDHAFPMARRES